MGESGVLETMAMHWGDGGPNEGMEGRLNQKRRFCFMKGYIYYYITRKSRTCTGRVLLPPPNDEMKRPSVSPLKAPITC